MTVYKACSQLSDKDRIVIGAICCEISGYMNLKKEYVEENNMRVRDWPMGLLSEAITFVAKFKPRKKVVVRRKVPYVTEAGGD